MDFNEIEFLSRKFSYTVISEWVNSGIKLENLPEILTQKQVIRLKELGKYVQSTEQFVTYNDLRWPKALDQITPRAVVLYYEGDLTLITKYQNLAVVGARNISAYAKMCIDTIIKPVFNKQLTVISGLAYGVDAYAHKIALQSESPCIAVIGGGLDNESLYPGEHLGLKNQILENGGLVLSEYPAGSKPLPHHFVGRNRIIAALSDLTFVVQATLKSGSLITATYALELGKDIATLPARVEDQFATGNLSLIKNGAHCITCVEDLSQLLKLQTPHLNQVTLDHPLADFLRQPITSDDLCSISGLTLSQILSELTLLEIQGAVVQERGLWTLA